MSKGTVSIPEILALAARLPSGLNDGRAAIKLRDEQDELIAANAKGDTVGALTEAADAVYYCVKHLDWVSRQVGVDIDGLFYLAAAKYGLRARPGNPKDDQAERAAVAAAAERLAGRS